MNKYLLIFVYLKYNLLNFLNSDKNNKISDNI